MERIIRQAPFGFVVLTVLLASGIRLIGGLNYPSTPFLWCIVEATGLVGAIGLPFLSVYLGMRTMDSWKAFFKALGSAWIFLVLSSSGALMVLLIKHHGMIYSNTSNPWGFALGGLIATLIWMTAIAGAGVLLGKQARFQRIERWGFWKMIFLLVILEGIGARLEWTFITFFYLTVLGGAGFTHWIGIPFFGVRFPWPDFWFIVMGSLLLLVIPSALSLKLNYFQR